MARSQLRAIWFPHQVEDICFKPQQSTLLSPQGQAVK
jgi:hypothetical protein